jgi:hypothetical protein
MQPSPACAASLHTKFTPTPSANGSACYPDDFLYRVMTVAAIFLVLSSIWVL